MRDATKLRQVGNFVKEIGAVNQKGFHVLMFI
jgi:hypothetical protein